MASPENRISTTLVQDTFLDPDSYYSSVSEDWEDGPIYLNDTSKGLQFQDWKLTWNPANSIFTVTPQTIGTPQDILTIADVIQCSFCFDQNAHVNIAYRTSNSIAGLYWYDTDLGGWTTSALPAGANTPSLTLDDKRTTQSQTNDIQLWYTIQQGDLSYNLYMRQQRDRFLTEYLMHQNVFPYIHKVGMHKGLRNQLELKTGPY